MVYGLIHAINHHYHRKIYSRKISSNGDQPDWLVCEGSSMYTGISVNTLHQVKIKDDQLKNHVLLFTENNAGTCLSGSDVTEDNWDKHTDTDASGRTTVTVNLHLKRGKRRVSSRDLLNCGKVKLREDRQVMLQFLEDDQGRLIPDHASAAIIQKYRLFKK